MNRSLILGTRGSTLALAQTSLVVQALARTEPDLHVEIKKIVTSGDKEIVPLPPAGIKGLFTKEIEEHLSSGAIDAAVHSLKDLPGFLPDDLKIAAVLERADPSDILISKTYQSFKALPYQARIGTSSIRRKKQLLWLRPDLQILPMRGNVPSRLQTLRETAGLDAIVLAKAGLDRLGLEPSHFKTQVLQTLPAICQGVIALEIRSNDARTAAILNPINHQTTFQCIRAERELLRLLNGDCRLPVGVKSSLTGSRLRLRMILFRAENESPWEGELEGSADNPEKLALDLFQSVI